MLLASEKLSIFVSSTIAECAEERSVARRAIRSLNHNPIIFEDLGARPHPPRAMYLRGFREARIFIGIYRDSYGWIAPGMSISGVEDELRMAERSGVPRLLYEYSPTASRDPRLGQLLEEAKQSGVTVARYDTPESLFDRLRDDITATIVEKFIGLGATDSLTPLAAKARLEHLIASLGPLVDRQHVEAELAARLSTNPIVAVIGPAGSGKSVLLTQASARNGWLFVDAEGLSPARVQARCAQALRHAGGDTPTYHATTEPHDSFADIWARSANVTLVVDGLESADVLLALVRDTAAAPAGRRLVIASRSAPLGIVEFPVPRWQSEEVRAFARAAGREPTGEELKSLVEDSAGNPLFLRFAVLQPGRDASASLVQYELATFLRQDPRARELLYYLALSNAALDLGVLGELLGDPPLSPEAVSEIASPAKALLKDTEGGFRLIHMHFGETLIEDLRQSRARVSFYAERLARVLRGRGETLLAYEILAREGDPTAEGLLPEAAFLASARGEIDTALQLQERRLALARGRADIAGALTAMLNLAIAAAQAGQRERSREWIKQAEQSLEQSPDSDWVLHVREASAQIELMFGGTTKALETLATLRQTYESLNDAYGIARINMHLSTTYVQTNRFDEALAASSKALEAFTASRDDYGQRQASANRAVALSALGRQSEADALIAALDAEEGGSRRRLRALTCNVLARRHREAGDTEAARRYSSEAIRLGEMLGDRHVVVLNRINLGNAYRDDGANGVPGAYDRALSAYGEAREEASRLGFRGSESHALRLLASVHRRQERFAVALTDAEAAVAIAKDTIDTVGLAEAHRERANALRGMRRYAEAATGYLLAATTIAKVEGLSSYHFELIRRALAADYMRDDAPSDDLLAGLSEAFGQRTPTDEKVRPFREQVDSVIRGYIARVPEIPATDVFATTVALLDTVLHHCPEQLAPLIALGAAEMLARDTPPPGSRSSLLALVGFLTSRAMPSLSNQALVRVVEALPANSGLYFRPQADGAAHWTLRLDLGRPVVCTITQMDDSPQGFFMALALAALLWAFQEQVHRQLLFGVPLARDEVEFDVTAVEEFQKHVQKEVVFKGPCSVTRSTNPKTAEQVPILVLYKEHELRDLRGEGSGAPTVHYLCGRAVTELVFHLLQGEVDLDSLTPKVVSLIREVY